MTANEIVLEWRDLIVADVDVDVAAEVEVDVLPDVDVEATEVDVEVVADVDPDVKLGGVNGGVRLGFSIIL